MVGERLAATSRTISSESCTARLKAEGKLSGVTAFFMRDAKRVEELYDIQSDPHEQVNLADSLEHRQVLAAGKTVEFYIYEGADHNLASNFSPAMQRTIEFFNTYVKGP